MCNTPTRATKDNAQHYTLFCDTLYSFVASMIYFTDEIYSREIRRHIFFPFIIPSRSYTLLPIVLGSSLPTRSLGIAFLIMVTAGFCGATFLTMLLLIWTNDSPLNRATISSHQLAFATCWPLSVTTGLQLLIGQFLRYCVTRLNSNIFL